jgi:hypothetical protein
MSIQQDIHGYIQFVQWDIDYLSNTFSEHIQMVIQAYPTEYPNISRGISHLSNWMSNWISGLNCSPGIRSGSCIAIQICILAPGPASSAASDALPQCSKRKRVVCNACSLSHCRAACAEAPGLATVLSPPLLRGSRQCCASASSQRQVRQACACDIADPSIAVHARMDIMISRICCQR